MEFICSFPICQMMGGPPMGMGSSQQMMGNNMGGGFGAPDNFRPRNYSPPRRRFRSVSLLTFQWASQSSWKNLFCWGDSVLPKMGRCLEQFSPSQSQFIYFVMRTHIVWYQLIYASEKSFEEPSASCTRVAKFLLNV
jgi:hypothetical protein